MPYEGKQTRRELLVGVLVAKHDRHIKFISAQNKILLLLNGQTDDKKRRYALHTLLIQLLLFHRSELFQKVLVTKLYLQGEEVKWNSEVLVWIVDVHIQVSKVKREKKMVITQLAFRHMEPKHLITSINHIIMTEATHTINHVPTIITY